MRVTKAIREYVEEEIRKKYQEKKNLVGKEYEEERNAVVDKLQAFLDEANWKALEYAKSSGYELQCYRSPADAFHWHGRLCKPEQEEINSKERQLLDRKCDAKIKQVLFDLEMGETAKAELKDVLDNLVID